MMRSNGHLGITKAIVLLWTLGLCATAVRGAGFAGGTGEPNDPYKIAAAARGMVWWARTKVPSADAIPM